MDTQLKYQSIIKDVLQRYADYPSPHADIHSRLALDDEHGSYALLQAGWYGDEYLHGAIIHIDVIEGKIWVQLNDLSQIPDQELVLEIYRRIKGDDEMSQFRQSITYELFRRFQVCI